LIIVDASVAVQWVADEATSLLSDTLLDREDLIAPDFMLVEAANALYRKVFVGDLSQEQARAGLEFIRDKVDLRALNIDLLDRAIALANEMNHPVYDCLYLALAEHTSALVVTYDRELLDRARYYKHESLVTQLPLP
jgi:predicted nucleic acid-binding protein